MEYAPPQFRSDWSVDCFAGSVAAMMGDMSNLADETRQGAEPGCEAQRVNQMARFNDVRVVAILGSAIV